MSMTIDCAKNWQGAGKRLVTVLPMLITVAPAPDRQTWPVSHQALLSRVGLSGQLLNACLVEMDTP